MSFPTTFTPSRVTREDIVEWSVFNYIKTGLAALGVPSPSMVDYIESFNTNLFEKEIDKSYIAAGFHMNDGGHLFELGSNLRRKIYTFEYWIIGLNATQGRNLAHLVSQIVESNLIIPIQDITKTAPYPTLGALEAAEEPSKVERQVVGNPEPWQEHLYCAHVRVMDEYYAPTAPLTPFV